MFVCCCLIVILSLDGLMCSPVVALIDYQDFFPKPNVNEVADVFSVPLSYLLDERNVELVFMGQWTSIEWRFQRESDGKVLTY